MDAISLTQTSTDSNGAAISFYKRGSSSDANAALSSGLRLCSYYVYGWDGATYRRAAYTSVSATQDYVSGSVGSSFTIGTTLNGTSSATSRLIIDNDGTVMPAADNAQTLGKSSKRWSAIWAANGTIQTSDVRDKTQVEALSGPLAQTLIAAIEPKTFLWKSGGRVQTGVEDATDAAGNVTAIYGDRAGQRRHSGFIAQDIKAALDAAGIDFGAWGLDDVNDPDSRQWLRPDQLVPVLWAGLRALSDRVATLEAAEA